MARTRADTGNNPPPKRRKLNGTTDDAEAPAAVRESSSSDELAATSDYEIEERHGDSRSAKKVTENRRQYKRQSHGQSGSESPDKLSMDADALWSRNARDQSRAKDEEELAHPDHEDDENQQEIAETKVEPEDLPPAQGDINGDPESSEAHTAEPSEKLPTPEPSPPPPPPKPDHVNYVQKHLLKGHLRGVSAVKFSPDQTMLASGGMFLQVSLHRRYQELMHMLTHFYRS